MKKIRKLFFEVNVSWLTVILMSVFIGIGVAVINRIPLFEDTSFSDIAAVMDVWIYLALFIILNSKKVLEAISKCFVFFLISQPLIYFVEAVIDTVFSGADFMSQLIMFFQNYYIGADWLLWTVLTIPGAFIAYQVKRNNIMSALILAVATCYYASASVYFLFNSVAYHFPRHMLSGVFCLASIMLIFILLTGKKERIIATAITVAMLIVSIVMSFVGYNTPPEGNTYIELEKGTKIVSCVVADGEIASAEIEEERLINVNTVSKTGDTEIKVTDDKGNTYIYKVVVTSREVKAELQK